MVHQYYFFEVFFFVPSWYQFSCFTVAPCYLVSCCDILLFLSLHLFLFLQGSVFVIFLSFFPLSILTYSVVRLIPRKQYFGWSNLWHWIYHGNLEWSKCKNKSIFFSHTRSKCTLLPTSAYPAPYSYVAGWHTVELVVLAPCLPSWPRRFVAALQQIAAARLLLSTFTENI